jgi:uncharacterized membrane protein
MWPYAFSGGVYNLLFGGAATLGGLLLIAISMAFYTNRGLKAISYFAVVLGLYLIIDAYSILNYNLTRNPMFSAVLYAAPAVATFLSVPATHTDNIQLRRLFAISAFLFALAWLYFAANVTIGHLQPPA